jgi:hypothetical protein
MDLKPLKPGVKKIIYIYGLTLKNSTFCSNRVCLCILYGSQTKQRLFADTVLANEWFCNRNRLCLLRGTN